MPSIRLRPRFPRFSPLRRPFSPLRPLSIATRIPTTTTAPPVRDPTVRIVEVGPRDGLQNERNPITSQTKLELIRRLRKAGLRNVEAGAFVSPKWVPQMAASGDIADEIRSWRAEEGVWYPFLVPNEKGLEEALRRGVREVAVFLSASEGFSKKNLNCSVEESFSRTRPVVERAVGEGIRVRGYVSMIFSCPYSGPTPKENVLRVTQTLREMGCYEVSLGDTVGTGTAGSVRSLLGYLLGQGIPASYLAMHFHDTYGQAVANVLAAYDMGIRAFDASVAGLGGCPYAKGASGNLATEDLVRLLEGLGERTGVDIEELAKVGDWISREVGRRNESRVGRAILSSMGQSLGDGRESKL